MSKHIIRAYSNNFAPSSGENKILPRYDSGSIMVDNVVFTKQNLSQIESLGDAFGIHLSANCKGELILDEGQTWTKQEMFSFFQQFKNLHFIFLAGSNTKALGEQLYKILNTIISDKTSSKKSKQDETKIIYLDGQTNDLISFEENFYEFLLGKGFDADQAFLETKKVGKKFSFFPIQISSVHFFSMEDIITSEIGVELLDIQLLVPKIGENIEQVYTLLRVPNHWGKADYTFVTKGTTIIWELGQASGTQQRKIKDLVDVLFVIPGCGVPYRELVARIKDFVETSSPEVPDRKLKESEIITPEVCKILAKVNQLCAKLGSNSTLVTLYWHIFDLEIKNHANSVSKERKFLIIFLIEQGTAILTYISDLPKPKTIKDLMELLGRFSDCGGALRNLKEIVEKD